MTVPTVIASHKKEEVETRLKKFYTAVYNAHRLENINGNYMVDADNVRSWFEEIDNANKNYGAGHYDDKSFNMYMCKQTDSYQYGTAGCFWLIKNNGFKIPDDYPFKI